MPNGIQSGRDCAWCRAHTSCHPWGDPDRWYCYTCCRWFEITDCAEELRRVLFRRPAAHNHDGSQATALVLTNEMLTYMICDFAEFAFADLPWG